MKTSDRKNQKQPPFIIIRCFGTGRKNRDFLDILFEAQKKYHGLVNEIWFAGGSFDGMAHIREQAYETLTYREICRKLDINFSFQQGNTLGHSAADKAYPDLPDDCWNVSSDGKLHRGILCPNHPAAQQYTYQIARTFMEILQPDSYWPDDDMRLMNKTGIACCCDRCMDEFNARFHCRFDRAALHAALTGKGDETMVQIRKNWQLFCQQRLSDFAAVFRRAADDVAPDCRLGLQAVSSSWVHDGEDFKGILSALSGNRHTVGIRPGALYYTDNLPRDMIRKALDMLKEAARCKDYGFVDQVCAEVENYPHISAGKNPDGQMTEAAVMLACKVDSLALYWGADVNAETDENYRNYFELLAARKPFFQAIKTAFADSMPTGGALFRGSNKLALPEWQLEGFETETQLVCNSLPITRMAAHPEFWILDARCAEELSETDIGICFKNNVLMDIPAWKILVARFPAIKFSEMAKIIPLEIFNNANADVNYTEIFADGKQAQDLLGIIRLKCSNAIALSKTGSSENDCGSVMLPTPYGGKIVLIQQLACRWLWTSPRRDMILNALDSIHQSGGMAVRLLTGGFAVWVIAHSDEQGKTVGAFLLNFGIGTTMPLKIALRRPAVKNFELLRADGTTVELNPISHSENEIICQLPPLNAFQPILIRPCLNANSCR